MAPELRKKERAPGSGSGETSVAAHPAASSSRGSRGSWLEAARGNSMLSATMSASHSVCRGGNSLLCAFLELKKRHFARTVSLLSKLSGKRCPCEVAQQSGRRDSNPRPPKPHALDSSGGSRRRVVTTRCSGHRCCDSKTEKRPGIAAESQQDSQQSSARETDRPPEQIRGSAFLPPKPGGHSERLTTRDCLRRIQFGRLPVPRQAR